MKSRGKKPGAMRARFFPFLLGAFAFLLLAGGIAAWLLQENIAQYAMKPRIPFDTTPPPPAPDYGLAEAWIAAPPDFPARSLTMPEGAADIFFVHDTTYRSKEGWNATFSDPDALWEATRIALPNQAGPFKAIGPIFAPKYRQATMSSFFTLKHQGRASRLLAYSDVKRAFNMFAARRNDNRPLILVGYGQGGLHVQGLLADFFQTKDNLNKSLVAAYVIGQSNPIDMFETLYPETPLCSMPQDVRCVITYSAYTPDHEREIWRAKNRHLVPEGEGTLKTVSGRPISCINPISWLADNKIAPMEQHLGAASATGPDFGTDPVILENLVAAQCRDGILITSLAPQRYLRRPKFFGRQWLPLNFNLFYEDIRINAALRTTVLYSVLLEEGTQVPPIGEVVDINKAPIRQVPK